MSTFRSLKICALRFRLSLSLPPLRAERVTVFCFRLFRSLVPRSQKSKTKMVWGTYPNFSQSVVLTLWRSAKPVGYWTVRRGRRFLMSLRSDYQSRITSHQSPFDALTLAQGGPLAFHFSRFTNPSPSHFSRRASGLAVRLQDLFLILS
jgi:hypothetical protein